jgi:hypothetical protein
MSKPKLTPYKVVTKSFIVWGKAYNDEIKAFLKSDITKDNYHQIKKLKEFVIVDYDKNKREWYVTYFYYDTVLSCSIDDISGTYSTTTF